MAITSASGVQHWLYPINRGSDYVLHTESDGPPEDNKVTRENVWADVEEYPDRVDDWYLSTGYKSMRPGDLVWIVDVYPPKAIVAMAHATEIYEDDFGWHVDLVWDQKVTRALKKAPIPKDAYGQTVQTVGRANQGTATILDQWLKTNSFVAKTPGPGGKVIIGDEDTRKKVLRDITVRRGQSSFRSSLLALYEGACAVTGSTAEAVLEAAHIQPYRGEHTNDVRNGILLRSDIHTLFDLHLLAVDPQGTIRVSSTLKGTEYWKHDGKALRVPKYPNTRPGKNLLKEHAKHFVA